MAPLGRVGAAADGQTVFGAHLAGSSLTAWTPGAAALTTVGTTAVPGTVIEAQGLADGRIVVHPRPAIDGDDPAPEAYVVPLAVTYAIGWAVLRGAAELKDQVFGEVKS